MLIRTDNKLIKLRNIIEVGLVCDRDDVDSYWSGNESDLAFKLAIDTETSFHLFRSDSKERLEKLKKETEYMLIHGNDNEVPVYGGVTA